MFDLVNALSVSHSYMDDFVKCGDIVVDATVGNGNDTVRLAKLVGTNGHVYGFDVQESALKNARSKLEGEGLVDRVTLFCDSHEHMAKRVKAPVAFVGFNLGFLPGGDKSVTTYVDTSVAAVRSALEMLKVGGLLTVCVYPGHDEGKRELAALLDVFAALDSRAFTALYRAYINQPKRPPELLAALKMK